MRGTLGQLISFVNRSEVEISEIHVAERPYMYGQNVLSFAQINFEKLGRQIPVVPLAPSQRVCRVICCRDLQWSNRVFSVHVH